MKPPQGPPSTPPATPEQEPVLSFEEFIFIDRYKFPRYNNFFLLFQGGLYDYVLEKEWYKKFASKHPDMEKSLRNKIQNRDRTKGNLENLKPFENELWEAYKLMRSYGATDKELLY